MSHPILGALLYFFSVSTSPVYPQPLVAGVLLSGDSSPATLVTPVFSTLFSKSKSFFPFPEIGMEKQGVGMDDKQV